MFNATHRSAAGSGAASSATPPSPSSPRTPAAVPTTAVADSENSAFGFVRVPAARTPTWKGRPTPSPATPPSISPPTSPAWSPISPSAAPLNLSCPSLSLLGELFKADNQAERRVALRRLRALLAHSRRLLHKTDNWQASLTARVDLLAAACQQAPVIAEGPEASLTIASITNAALINGNNPLALRARADRALLEEAVDGLAQVVHTHLRDL